MNNYKIGPGLVPAFRIVLVLMTPLSPAAIYSLWQINNIFSNISENSQNIEFANEVWNEIQEVNRTAMMVALVDENKTRTEQEKTREGSTKNYQASFGRNYASCDKCSA